MHSLLLALEGSIALLEAPAEKLSQRVYNITGFSFTPKELAASIKKVMPEFQISYKPDFRQVRYATDSECCL